MARQPRQHRTVEGAAAALPEKRDSKVIASPCTPQFKAPTTNYGNGVSKGKLQVRPKANGMAAPDDETRTLLSAPNTGLAA